MNASDDRLMTEDEKLFTGVLLLNAKVVGLVLGILFALGIFVATNWLVIKGGERVGPHLQLLSQYFIGYKSEGNPKNWNTYFRLQIPCFSNLRCAFSVDLQ
jgi:hypothetical protein